MEQLAAIVAVCRLAILKRMPTTPLTLLVAHRQQPPLRNVRQPVTSSLSEVETDSQRDVVDRVVGSSHGSLSEESSPETDFIPDPRAETSKYGRKRTLVERDNYVSWEKIVF